MRAEIAAERSSDHRLSTSQSNPADLPSVKILYSSNEVRREIRRVLAPGGRRVAAVAFVGSGAEAYLPSPKGLELYCWPEASATNADTVEHLMARGVRAYFVPRLHMKVFWSERRGAVIASANLSTNALGSGGLKELGVSLPPGAVKITQLLRGLDAVPVTAAALEKLRKLNRAQVRGGRAGEQVTYADWYTQPRRPRWTVAATDGYAPASERAKEVTMQDRGSREPEECIACAQGAVSAEEHILVVDCYQERVGAVYWTYAHRIVRLKPSDRARREGMTTQAVQIYPMRACPPPPFAIDAKLRSALKKIDWTDEGISRPSAALVRKIYGHYVA